MVMIRMMESYLSEFDNQELASYLACWCMECDELPRLFPVFRDNGVVREHCGFVVRCRCISLDFVFPTRENAVRYWNYLQNKDL